MTTYETDYAYDTTTSRLDRAVTPEICALVQDLLPLYLEGEVNPGSRDTIVNHLAHCERCAGYLAGAQSMRVQLRRDAVQRTAALHADLPQRGIVLRLRDIVASGLAMLLCLPGGAAAALIGSGLANRSDEMLGGLMIATIISIMILALARVLGPLTNRRLSAIGGGIAFGGAGVILLMSGSMVAILTGFGIGIAGLISVWSGVARDGKLPYSEHF
jgi:hypothetical protein